MPRLKRATSPAEKTGVAVHVTPKSPNEAAKAIYGEIPGTLVQKIKTPHGESQSTFSEAEMTLRMHRSSFSQPTPPIRYPGSTDMFWLVLFLSSFLVVVVINKSAPPIANKIAKTGDFLSFIKEDAPAILLPLLGTSLMAMILLNLMGYYSKGFVSVSFFVTPAIIGWVLIWYFKASSYFPEAHENRFILIATMIWSALVFRYYKRQRIHIRKASEAMKESCFILGKPSTLASHLLLQITMLSIWGLWTKYVIETIATAANPFAGFFCSLQLLVFSGYHVALWNMITGRHVASHYFNFSSGFLSCAVDTVVHGSGTAAILGGIYAILCAVKMSCDAIIKAIEPEDHDCNCAWIIALPFTWPFYLLKWIIACWIVFFSLLVPLVAGITCQPFSGAVTTTAEHLTITEHHNFLYWICKVLLAAPAVTICHLLALGLSLLSRWSR
jgi:hypothetical protein